MEKAGIIRPSTSSWSSPIVPVTKKDGSIRICINYQALNLKTVHNVYPLPNISEIFDCCGGCKWISVGDVIHGFHNCKVAPQDRDKTAFTVPGLGLFEFVRCPQGIQQMPSLFQNMMDIILAGLKYKVAMGFIDDFIIFSRTFDEHIEHIDLVFGRFQDAGLKFKLKKCNFACKRVEFLGHVITPDGLLVNEAKIQNVRDADPPTTVTQVQAFLGLTGYYRQFVQNYAKIAKPMVELTQKAMPFIWGQHQQNAFEILKKKLISAPILAYPMMDQSFLLYTDSSRQAFGAVLAQVQEGKERVIAYYSRTIAGSERNYGVTDIEMAAACAAIKKFKHYLYEQPFDLITDHLPLKYIFKSNLAATNRLERLKLSVLTYVSRMTVIYKPGKKHQNADALSRFFFPKDPDPEETNSKSENRVVLFIQATEQPQIEPIENENDIRGEILTELSEKDRYYFDNIKKGLGCPMVGFTIKELKEEQSKDAECAEILQNVVTEKRPTLRDLLRTEGSPKLRTPLPEYDLEEGILVRVDYQWSQNTGRTYAVAIVLPKTLKNKVMEYFHENPWAGAHQGELRTYQLIARKFFWPHMRKDIQNHVKDCISCAKYKAPSKLIKAEMQRLPTVTHPWDGICSDIMGPMNKTVRGNTYIITFTDYFTRWSEAFPLPETTAETITKIFVENIICRYGCPRFLVTDQGSNYMSGTMGVICKMFDIHHIRTSPYHPQTDGVSERFNRTIIGSISHYLNEGMTDWDEKLPIIMFALRNQNHRATNEIPYFALFGRNPRLPNIAYLKHPNPQYVDIDDYKTSLLINLRDTWASIQKQLENSWQSSKNYADKTANTTPSDWKVGDKVFVNFPKRPKIGSSAKFVAKWRGPYRIEKVFHPNVRILPLFAPHTRAKLEVVHVNRLKPFRGDWLPNIESNFTPPHESIQDIVAPTIPDPPTQGASLAPAKRSAKRTRDPVFLPERPRTETTEQTPPVEKLLQTAIKMAQPKPKRGRPPKEKKLDNNTKEPPSPPIPTHQLGRPSKFGENEVIWAKYTGYPFWPARIVTTIECPAVLLEKLKKPGTVPVYFYGSKNYAVLSETSIRDFDDFFDKATSKCHTNPFKAALRHAQDDLHDTQ